MSRNWFNPPRVVSRKRLLQTFAKQRDRGGSLPRLRGARIIDMDAWKYPRVGRKVFYMDREETVYVTRDIQRMFDVDKTTVYSWIKVGLIPPPLFTKRNHYHKETRYWVRPQLAAAALVINDLRRQGAIRFTSDRVKTHISMLKQGNKEALRAWHKRRERRARKAVTWIE